ncbi:two-component regulator propeller domain-containing protein [Spiroplasma endosymbiont of Asaphidion curtum]|uniref:two-component regulator propeller domain-containing protein n=1 Tax=Spiroplasma endosymbiont of Asaphidion curtum TaxID=3066281 RepID=UPI00313CB8BA
MKKLLGMLGTITILGSAMSTVIAASPYPYFKKLNKEYTVTKIAGIEKAISSMAIDSQNNVYYGASNGLVYKLKNNEVIVSTINGIENNSRIESIIIDTNDNVYFATSTGGYKLNNNETIITKIAGIEDYVWLALIDNSNNVYFVSNNDGIYKLINNKAEKIPKIIGKILTFIVDKNNNKFYWILNKGIFLLKNGENNSIKICGIKGGYGFLTFVDNDNNIYIGAKKKDGYSLYVIKNNENWGTKIKNINTQVRSIATDNNNNIYIGTDNKGAFSLSTIELTKEKPRAKQINELKTNTGINAIAVDSQNNVYFGGGYDFGFYIIENNKKIKINEINNPVFFIISNQNKIYVSTIYEGYIIE